MLSVVLFNKALFWEEVCFIFSPTMIKSCVSYRQSQQTTQEVEKRQKKNEGQKKSDFNVFSLGLFNQTSFFWGTKVQEVACPKRWWRMCQTYLENKHFMERGAQKTSNPWDFYLLGNLQNSQKEVLNLLRTNEEISAWFHEEKN